MAILKNEQLRSKWESGALKYSDNISAEQLQVMWVRGGHWQMQFAARYVALKMLKYDRMANGDVSILDTDRERIADECADHILRGQDKFDPARDFQNWAWEVAENKMKNLRDRSDEVLDHAERNLQPKMGQDEHNREEALVADDSTASADTQAMKNWERGERGGGGGDSRSVVDVIRDDVKLRFAYSLCRKPGNVHERRMALYCANYYFLRTRQHLDELLAKVNDRRRKASIKKGIKSAIIARIAKIESKRVGKHVDERTISKSIERCYKAISREYRETMAQFDATYAWRLRRLQKLYANIETRGLRVYLMYDERSGIVQIGDKQVLGRLLTGWTGDEIEAGAVFRRACPEVRQLGPDEFDRINRRYAFTFAANYEGRFKEEEKKLKKLGRKTAFPVYG